MFEIVHVAMLLVEHGKRRGAILVGILLGSFLSLLGTELTVNWAYGNQEYYTKHAWPKTLAVAVPGLVCVVIGLVLLPASQKVRDGYRALKPEARRELGEFDVMLSRYFDLVIGAWGVLLLGLATVNLLVGDPGGPPP
jgi:hypothetical protein